MRSLPSGPLTTSYKGRSPHKHLIKIVKGRGANKSVLHHSLYVHFHHTAKHRFQFESTENRTPAAETYVHSEYIISEFLEDFECNVNPLLSRVKNTHLKNKKTVCNE